MEVELFSVMSDQLVILQYFTFIFSFPNNSFTVIFKCDIPVVFYEFNMYSAQLAVKTQLIYCTVCTMYKNYMFRPILAIFRFFV